ncbi:uncharacterized protein RAG0_14927 [Rhynchosporium agropyri]|uniref:Uncharacterized protein n=1 Tax=Rhynchosporium agropyri TaxID=914238 RepID=A0A1E1LIW5_9HELO|nr:uncharacterized protein RAG0_14927 [Rhynchosporium agropyri]
MSAAIAMAPSPAPHDRPSYVDIAPSAPQQHHPSTSPPRRITTSATPNHTAQRIGSGSPKSTPISKSSPNTSRNGNPPKIIVKKEPPSSPDLPASRHRPRKLDLSKNTSSANPATSRPSAGQLTSRGESGGLLIHDVGLACLSPGFQTQDPTMREQLQRSISVREQQRQLIEQRLQQTAKPGDAPMESAKERELGGSGFPAKTPGTSKRKAPPGLSIVAPSHEQFAHERVIQSAPLNQSFTGRHQPHPLTRHIANHSSNLSNTSHIHHVPANQTANRLPPITDVFAAEQLGAHREIQTSRGAFFPNNTGSASNSSHSNSRPTFPSPSHNNSNQPPITARPREYRSAEDAQAELAGGRPELLPKLVHYGGGHQPHSPPSPMTGNSMRQGEINRSGGARRRTRTEYEEGGSPPLGSGPSTTRRTGPFGEGRDSPSSQQRKKEEFMKLCDRAWDLFHS